MEVNKISLCTLSQILNKVKKHPSQIFKPNLLTRYPRKELMLANESFHVDIVKSFLEEKFSFV